MKLIDTNGKIIIDEQGISRGIFHDRRPQVNYLVSEASTEFFDVPGNILKKIAIITIYSTTQTKRFKGIEKPEMVKR